MLFFTPSFLLYLFCLIAIGAQTHQRSEEIVHYFLDNTRLSDTALFEDKEAVLKSLMRIKPHIDDLPRAEKETLVKEIIHGCLFKDAHLLNRLNKYAEFYEARSVFHKIEAYLREKDNNDLCFLDSQPFLDAAEYRPALTKAKEELLSKNINDLPHLPLSQEENTLEYQHHDIGADYIRKHVAEQVRYNLAHMLYTVDIDLYVKRVPHAFAPAEELIRHFLYNNNLSAVFGEHKDTLLKSLSRIKHCTEDLTPLRKKCMIEEMMHGVASVDDLTYRLNKYVKFYEGRYVLKKIGAYIQEVSNEDLRFLEEYPLVDIVAYLSEITEAKKEFHEKNLTALPKMDIRIEKEAHSSYRNKNVTLATIKNSVASQVHSHLKEICAWIHERPVQDSTEDELTKKKATDTDPQEH